MYLLCIHCLVDVCDMWDMWDILPERPKTALISEYTTTCVWAAGQTLSLARLFIYLLLFIIRSFFEIGIIVATVYVDHGRQTFVYSFGVLPLSSPSVHLCRANWFYRRISSDGKLNFFSGGNRALISISIRPSFGWSEVIDHKNIIACVHYYYWRMSC